ncbi:hypothetical protein [Clostridium disporicum]|uniref:hypothetical protein n=1 Tax=Clostridium disporicum TaxID=84024 RepID=UPI0034A291FC
MLDSLLSVVELLVVLLVEFSVCGLLFVVSLVVLLSQPTKSPTTSKVINKS